MNTETGGDAVQRLKARAEELGFDAVRITTAAAPGHSEHARSWLQAGMHGEMSYLLNRAALRAAPLDHESLLAGTRSVVMVALSYHPSDRTTAIPESASGQGNAEPSEPHLRSLSPRGVVARYARGEDYHQIFREKLKAFARWITETWPGEKARGMADSGPVRERELAARAGIGWQGKHTNLISLDLGNWFFLGTLLTTLPLPPDAPVENHCGTCTRCLTACPTGALVAPMTLDSRRCISYLTIELKGAIPLELRPLMGARIFGCDDCLAACPWNERAQAGRETRLAALDEDRGSPDLLQWLALTETDETFQGKFTGTALLRPGRIGLRRNICVALGNVGRDESIPALTEVIQTDPSDLVREHADWAVKEIRTRQDLR